MFKSKKLYHLLILFFIVSLVIYIIHFIINYYQINHILFLEKKQLQDFLMKDPDHYYKSFSKKDLSIRKISSPVDYHYLIKKSCRDFTVYEKNKIVNCVSNVESVLKNVSDPWFDGVKACGSQWKFGCITGKLYEGGLPHTRYDVIILPEYVVTNYTDDELTKLILHEKIHVYQKMYPGDMDKYIQYHHFYKKIRRNEVSDARANPDLDEWIYNDSENQSYMALYKADSSNITDVTFYPNNSHFYEHPYEKMAYDMEKKLSQ
jgi:hypothetical protein